MDHEEIKYLMLTTAVLGFCFSYKEWFEIFRFDLGIYIATTVLVAVSVAVHELAHRNIAHRYGTTVKFRTWTSLLFTAMLIAILTNGYIVFAAVWVVSIGSKNIFRPKHKYPHVGPWERSKIAATGPLANFALALFAGFFAFKTAVPIWHKLMIINFWMAGMNLFPFFRILPILFVGMGKDFRNLTHKIRRSIWGRADMPYMEGEMIFFGSRMYSMFLLFLFSITATIVLYFGRIFTGVIVGFISAVFVWLFMEYYIEPTKQKDMPEKLKIWKRF